MNVARITKEIPLHLINPTMTLVPVRGVFTYEPSDPYGIKAVFRMGEMAEAVEWVFGRDLVATGLTRETGLGDVRIWPAEPDSGVESVYFSLSSPEGAALLQCPRAPLAQFLNATFDAVPYGAEEEFIDLDDTIAALLDGGL